MKIKNKALVKKKILTAQKKITDSKLHRIGQMLVEKAKIILEADVGRETKLADTIQYEVVNNELFIFSDNEIFTYYHQGTKPHIIRPKKPGGSLKFSTDQVVVRKDGTKINAFEPMLSKEVKHPGTTGNPIIRKVLFISKTQIREILNS